MLIKVYRSKGGTLASIVWDTLCNTLPSTVLYLSHSTTLKSCYYYLSGPLLTATSVVFEASRTIWR